MQISDKKKFMLLALIVNLTTLPVQAAVVSQPTLAMPSMAPMPYGGIISSCYINNPPYFANLFLTDAFGSKVDYKCIPMSVNFTAILDNKNYPLISAAAPVGLGSAWLKTVSEAYCKGLVASAAINGSGPGSITGSIKCRMPQYD